MNLRKHSTNISDSLPLSSSVILEVGNRGPVGRLVGSDSTRGAVRLDQNIVVNSLTKVYKRLDISLSLKRANLQKSRLNLLPEPKISWTCVPTVPGDIRGSIRA